MLPNIVALWLRPPRFNSSSEMIVSAFRGSQPHKNVYLSKLNSNLLRNNTLNLPSLRSLPPSSLSAPVLCSEDRDVRGHSPLWVLYNRSDSLPPISVIISVTENKALSEEELRTRGGTLRGGQRLGLCHRSDKPGLCAGLAGGLALLWVGNSGGINSKLIQWTALPGIKTFPEWVPVCSKSVWKHRGSHAANVTDASGPVLFGLSDIGQSLSPTFDVTQVQLLQNNTVENVGSQNLWFSTVTNASQRFLLLIHDVCHDLAGLLTV